VDDRGDVLIQEDPGNNPYIAKTWKVDPSNPTAAVQIFESDRSRFLTLTAPFSVDEENSGIIEVTDIVRDAKWAERYRRYYLGDMQAHYANPDPELVEGGQLYLMASPAPDHDGKK
jgi:hypothetical protein